MKSWTIRCAGLASVMVTLSSMLSSTLWAHPGHGVTEPGTLTHELTEPVHAVVWLLLLAIGGGLLAAAYRWQRMRRQHSVIQRDPRQRKLR